MLLQPSKRTEASKFGRQRVATLWLEMTVHVEWKSDHLHMGAGLDRAQQHAEN